MSFTIVGRRIHSKQAEVDIVDHCNLSCRSCSHLSPISNKALLSPEELYRDLSLLAKVFDTDRIKILGGEPLLHPQLAEIAQAIRTSGIAKKIALITNGLLLDRLCDRTLASIDEVVVSEYVSAPPGRDILARAAAIAERAHVVFRINRFEYFRETFVENACLDHVLVRRVYDTCEITHRFSCYSISRGFFYKCPQARPLARLAGATTSMDGIQIDAQGDMFDRLKSYLESRTPLAACSNCLGTVGKHFAHEQIPRGNWLTFAKASYQDLLDVQQLEALERGEETPIRTFSPVNRPDGSSTFTILES